MTTVIDIVTDHFKTLDMIVFEEPNYDSVAAHGYFITYHCTYVRRSDGIWSVLEGKSFWGNVSDLTDHELAKAFTRSTARITGVSTFGK